MVNEEQFEDDKKGVDASAEATESTEIPEADTKETDLDPVAALQAENEVLADRLLRAQAELANVQRRNAQERQDLLKYRSQKLAAELLGTLDNLERALAVSVTNEQAQSLKKGVEMAYESFIAALKAEGIEQIEALYQPFDPKVHQAVQQVAAQEGQASETVVHVLQNGFRLHERVIRPAMVIVTE